MATTIIKILLADDHRLLVEGLCRLLEEQRNIEVIGVAKDGVEAVNLANKHKPDIILLDITMPRLNGIDAARKILAEMPYVIIIILSMHADQRFIKEALHIGAKGYILKESAAREVIEAVKAVRKGEYYFSQAVRDKVMLDYVEGAREGNTLESPLSGREREVLQLLAEGKSTKEIAHDLHVSIKTIESHRKKVMDKLGLHSIAELTKYAIREGLTRLE